MADKEKSGLLAFKRFEHDGWAGVANTYSDHFAQGTMQAVEPVLDAAGVGQGTRVLDVACGPGMIAAAAAGRGARATGLDFVAGMLQEARQRHPHVDFRHGDAENLPFDDGTFDAVVCGFGILHFADPELAMAEALRVLTPGGRYAFTAWSSPDRSPLMGLIYAACQQHADLSIPMPQGPPTFRFGEAAECQRTMEKAGFSGSTTMELDIQVDFSHPEDVVEMIYKGTARTKGLLERQTEETRRKVEAAIVESVAAFAQDTLIRIPLPAVLALGRKPT